MLIHSPVYFTAAVGSVRHRGCGAHCLRPAERRLHGRPRQGALPAEGVAGVTLTAPLQQGNPGLRLGGPA